MFAENNSMMFVLLVVVFLLFVWSLYQQISLWGIKKRQRVLFDGSDGKNLEKVILDTKEQITILDGEIRDLYEITNKIHRLSHHGLHKMGVVRFNPFRDIGGDQSFSVALLDGENNGVVLSSLYSREGVRIYAKQLKNGKSDNYQLTEEEKHAISIASQDKDVTKNKKRV